MEKIRILVVDNHPIIGEALEFFLNRDSALLVLGSARDGQEGLRLLRRWNPDLVVLDLSMLELHGLEAIPLYLAANPRLKIVVYSAHTEGKIVDQVLKAGAHGFVVKGSSVAELQQAIHYVWAGGYWLSPQLNQSLIANYLNRQMSEEIEKDPLDYLTQRELQVMRLLVNGKVTSEISRLLAIAPSTVAKHRISLLRKLHLKNTVELTRFAAHHGLSHSWEDSIHH